MPRRSRDTLTTWLSGVPAGKGTAIVPSRVTVPLPAQCQHVTRPTLPRPQQAGHAACTGIVTWTRPPWRACSGLRGMSTSMLWTGLDCGQARPPRSPHSRSAGRRTPAQRVTLPRQYVPGSGSAARPGTSWPAVSRCKRDLQKLQKPLQTGCGRIVRGPAGRRRPVAAADRSVPRYGGRGSPPTTNAPHLGFGLARWAKMCFNRHVRAVCVPSCHLVDRGRFRFMEPRFGPLSCVGVEGKRFAAIHVQTSKVFVV
jgi:hypothetical protein